MERKIGVPFSVVTALFLKKKKETIRPTNCVYSCIYTSSRSWYVVQSLLLLHSCTVLRSILAGTYLCIFIYSPYLIYTSPITDISSTCKTINISLIQVHSWNEAMQQHCKYENDSVHWYVFGGGDVWKKIHGVTRGSLVVTPPPGCSGFRAFFPVRTFSEDYRALTGRKNRVLHYQYFLLWYFRYFSPSQELLVAMLAIHRCPQPVILYNQSPRATWLWQHTQKQQKKVKKKSEKEGRLWGPRESNSGREIRKFFYTSSVC